MYYIYDIYGVYIYIYVGYDIIDIIGYDRIYIINIILDDAQNMILRKYGKKTFSFQLVYPKFNHLKSSYLYWEVNEMMK